MLAWKKKCCKGLDEKVYSRASSSYDRNGARGTSLSETAAKGALPYFTKTFLATVVKANLASPLTFDQRKVSKGREENRVTPGYGDRHNYESVTSEFWPFGKLVLMMVAGSRNHTNNLSVPNLTIAGIRLATRKAAKQGTTHSGICLLVHGKATTVVKCGKKTALSPFFTWWS